MYINQLQITKIPHHTTAFVVENNRQNLCSVEVPTLGCKNDKNCTYISRVVHSGVLS